MLPTMAAGETVLPKLEQIPTMAKQKAKGLGSNVNVVAK